LTPLLTRTNIEHLAGVESSSRLQADRPSPGKASRQGPRIAFLNKLARYEPLYLSPSFWPHSPHSAARQRAPRAGRGAELVCLLRHAPAFLYISLTHTRTSSLSSESSLLPSSPSHVLPPLSPRKNQAGACPVGLQLVVETRLLPHSEPYIYSYLSLHL
jgi:hypothetical protein